MHAWRFTSFKPMVVFCALIAAAYAADGPSRNPFREAYTTDTPSIARADLLACRNLDKAQITMGGNLEVSELGKALQGTWVRELTWNGVPVETESGLYFDVHGENFNAMMFDQSNLGKGPLSKKLDAIKADPAQLAKTPKLTFVDCDFMIVDSYYKISDGFVGDGLKITAKASSSLKPVWEQLVAQGFFQRRYEIQKSTIAGQPLAEMLTPSVGGAYWNGSLKPANSGGSKGVSLKMTGEYRGSHVGDMKVQKDVQFHGSESAYFFREGNMLVSSVGVGPAQGHGVITQNRRRPSSPFSSSFLPPQPAEEQGEKKLDLNAGGWATDCAEFFDLPQPVKWERVVIQPPAVD